MRTLLVGVDGASLPVLKRLSERQAVPTVQSLVERGVSAALESHVPPWTPVAWPTLYTGVNPGKHGVFGFLHFEGYDWSVVDATHVREHPLWELLDHHGLSSVVNVPVTHPPAPCSGALVPGYMAPDPPACHPTGLLSDLPDHLGEYRIYSSHTGVEDAPRPDHLEAYRALVRMRGDAFRYLVDRFEPDFGFVQFQRTDTVVHERPGDIDALAAVYRAVDDQIGRILDETDADTVLLASDHGVGAYGGVECRVNDYLRAEGFAETVRADGMPSWARVRDDELHRTDGRGPDRTMRVLAVVTRLAATVGLTSQRLEPILQRAGLADIVLRWVPESVIPDGVVSPDAYETVRNDLIRRLQGLRTPDGEPVFEDVAPREAYFHGPHAGEAVDIVTVPTAFDHFLSATLLGVVFGEPTEPWNHKREGFIAATGEILDERSRFAEAHLLDVTPTVLATFGLSRGERMDGRVLPIAEDAGTRVDPEYEAEQGQQTSTTDVETRLNELGYLEKP